MTESALQKVLRLAAVPVHQYQRHSQSGRTQNVRQYTQSRAMSGMRLGTPYRASWGNVTVGDVLEFGPELWKVIPASSFPGYKPPTTSGVSTASGTGAATGGSTTGVTTGGSTASGTGAQTGGATTGTGTAVTYTNYLQNLRNPSQFDKLTLPSTFVVTIVPMLP